MEEKEPTVRLSICRQDDDEWVVVATWNNGRLHGFMDSEIELRYRCEDSLDAMGHFVRSMEARRREVTPPEARFWGRR